MTNKELAARLQEFVDVYDANNPPRTAEVHRTNCYCTRCLTDLMRSAARRLRSPETVVMSKAREVIAGVVAARGHYCGPRAQPCALCCDIADAITEALRSAGLVVVPAIPTDAMIIAGGEAQQTSIGSWGEPKLVWNHMIAASQSPQGDKEDK